MLTLVTFVTFKILREETEKYDFGEIIIHFQVFETLGKLEIRFRASLNKYFCAIVNISKVILLFIQNDHT